MNMKPKQPETLTDVLQQFLRAVGAEKRIQEMRLMQKWDEIVGRFIANDTRTINFQDGVLTVRFRSAIVRNEISMRRSAIISRLNEAMGTQIVSKIEVK